MATMTAVLPGQIQAEPKGYNERDATSETMDTQTARSALNMVRYFVADRSPKDVMPMAIRVVLIFMCLCLFSFLQICLLYVLLLRLLHLEVLLRLRLRLPP